MLPGARRELLPYTHQALDEETLTPQFVQHGEIMFCYRLIASWQPIHAAIFFSAA